MVSNNDTLDVFAFVAPGHPFFPAVERFRDAMRDAPGFRGFAALAGTADCEVHAELKAAQDADGQWRLERMYWSFQRSDAQGFRADTLYWRRDREMRVLGFPEDPSLRTMAAFLGAPEGEVGDLEVLRYVPLRRLTFRCTRATAGHGARRCIGKLKRASKVSESYARLAAVHRAVRRRRHGIAVARPLELAERACVFYQSALAGTPLVRGMEAASAPERLRRVGAVHRRLHELAVDGVGSWSLSAYRAGIEADARWIGLFVPDAAARLAPVLAALDRRPPTPVAPVFCHGDFIASQLLHDAATDRIAVTDFDMARHGDPDQERAKLLASLKYDLPPLREAIDRGEPPDPKLAGALEAAYLEGYRRDADRPQDPRRLAWFRGCAEIHYLALALRKDAWRPAAFAQTLDVVAALAGELHGRP